MADLEALRSHLTGGGGRLYVGASPGGGLALGQPQQSVLVLGPPRSGKTTALVVPNVLAAPGPVVATSTKPDVITWTRAERASLGRCWLLDPTGTVPLPPGVEQLRWSPVAAAARWDGALVVAQAMVGAARPDARRGESAHWVERAEATLAPLLHAAALAGTGMQSVLGWVLRHDAGTPRATLNGHEATIASDVLAGLIATDGREQSGIWSTTAGVLAAYRSEAALRNTADPNFDPAEFCAGRDTVYVCSSAEHQAAAAPIVVAFLTAIRTHTFARSAEHFRTGRTPAAHMLWALDEVANIAPLPDLPATVSEAGGQGLLILACLQDLSQARRRWGPEADGLLTLFGTKVVLGGLASGPTLELLSLLAGQETYASPSVHRSAWWARPSRSEGWSLAHRPRLAPDAIRQIPPGAALVIAGSQPPAMISVPPWSSVAPFAPRRQMEVPSRGEVGEARGLSP